MSWLSWLGLGRRVLQPITGHPADLLRAANELDVDAQRAKASSRG